VPCLSRLVPALAAVLVPICLVAAAPAAAGGYTVRQCDYASGNGHHDFTWRWAGNPTIDQYAGSGCGEFGLAARNSGGGTQRTYPSGAYGGWFAYAPEGTVFTSFSGAFGVLSGCCVNGMATYAEATQQPDGQGGRAYLFQGNLGNETWGAPSGVGGPVGRTWSATASGFDAKRVGFHMACGPGFSCSQGIYGDLRLRGRSFDFTLRDDAPPTVGEPTGTLVTGGWVRGERSLSFPAHDHGGGLARVEAVFGVGVAHRSPSSCTEVAGRYARLQPCPAARAAEWAVDTARLPDGGHGLDLAATDAGGGQTLRNVAVYVDNGAPAPPDPVAVVGGEGWRATNGYELAWSRPGGQHAPIVRAHWRACPADGRPGNCVGGSSDARGVDVSGAIALPAPGEWDAAVWLEDSAGNGDPTRASRERRLRYDPDPPSLKLVPRDAAAPGRVSATTSDLSGVVAGGIELRRQGSGAWTDLAATRSDERLVAELGPARLAEGGVYELRARAVDAAGNVAVAHSTLELQVPVPAWVGTPGPAPIFHGAGWRPRSDRPRPRSRGSARVTMTARVRRPRVRDVRRLVTAGGRPVQFRGRIGRPVPRGGKLLEVQAHFRGRWRTISTTRARRNGRWRFRYTFRTSRWPAVYRLRARVPVEAGYPFSAGASRPVRVTVQADRR